MLVPIGCDDTQSNHYENSAKRYTQKRKTKSRWNPKKVQVRKGKQEKKTEEPEKINNKVADLRANIQYFL